MRPQVRVHEVMRCRCDCHCHCMPSMIPHQSTDTDTDAAACPIVRLWLSTAVAALGQACEAPTRR